MAISRRLFFMRAAAVATCGTLVPNLSAFAKLNPLDDILRDMHAIKHRTDVLDLTWKYDNCLSDHYAEITRMFDSFLEKGMDLFPTPPSKDQVKELFRPTLKEGQVIEQVIAERAKAQYYIENGTDTLIIGAARHIFGIWRIPVIVSEVKRWGTFVKAYGPLLPDH